MTCICYCHGDHDQSADLCDHCRPPDYRQVLVQLLTAAEHQRDVRPGAVPQLLEAIEVAKEALSR